MLIKLNDMKISQPFGYKEKSRLPCLIVEVHVNRQLDWALEFFRRFSVRSGNFV